MIRTALRGFVQVFPVSANTALIAAGQLWAVFFLGYFISWWWRQNARDASRESSPLLDHAYAFGAGVGSVCGPLLVWGV